MPLKNTNSNAAIIIPALIGAAAAGAITYLLLSDDAKELRNQIGENLEKGVETLKSRIPATEELVALGGKLVEEMSKHAGQTSA